MTKKQITNLKIVKSQDPSPATPDDLQREEDSWRISHAEAAKRVHSLRLELEDYRDQLEAAQFDILCDAIPRSLDHSTRKWAVEIMEEFNPRIVGLFKRCEDTAEAAGLQMNDHLFDLKSEVSQTAFAIGLLAGALFSGARPETVDRVERGLLYSVQLNPQIVK